MVCELLNLILLHDGIDRIIINSFENSFLIKLIRIKQLNVEVNMHFLSEKEKYSP